MNGWTDRAECHNTQFYVAWCTLYMHVPLQLLHIVVSVVYHRKSFAPCYIKLSSATVMRLDPGT